MPLDSSRRTFLKGIAATGVVAGSAGCQGLLGGGAEEYPSQEIEFETPNPPGGGSDAYVRALAPALSSEFGVDVTPLNRTPAEQRVPTLFNGGEDGYNILHFNPAIHLWQIVQEGRETPFNPAEWQTLGAPNRAALILVASADSGLETWDDLLSRGEDGETFIGAGIGAGIQIYYDLISQNTPIDIEYAGGFEGTGTIVTELERGNVDLYHAPAPSLLSYVDDGICDPILTNSEEISGEVMLNAYADIGHEGIAEETYEGAGLDQLATLSQNTRACLAPPAVPEDRVQTLRDGFWATMTGDEFGDAAAEQNLPVNPLDGEDLQAVMQEKADIAVAYGESQS